MTRRFLLVCAVAVLTAGCSSTSASSKSKTITVYAASSLTGTFTTLAHQFEKAHPGSHVVLNFGASSTLAASIVNGAPADVFAAASPKNMATVVSAGEADAPSVFVRNSMEIAAARGNPAHIRTLTDLAGSSVKVALCDPHAPCGAVAAEVLRKANVKLKPISLDVDVKSTLAKVELGEVDAGLVYVTDVRAAGSKVVGVAIPDELNASTAYQIAALKHPRNPQLAQSFVGYVLSAAGQAVLTAAGFASP
jgi:molybdate transport system substrate-binding protein